MYDVAALGELLIDFGCISQDDEGYGYGYACTVTVTVACDGNM